MVPLRSVMYSLKPGASFDERYEIVQVLGAGAFGVVYKAVQKQFDRTVAIKVLNTAVMEDGDSGARFEREAKTINALKHKNIIGLYGFGVWNHAPYMVTEFAEGSSLDAVLAREGRLEAARAVKVMCQVLEGLNCAHTQGVIHRDLKPPNIMLCASPDAAESVKIIDFGLAKLLPGSDVSSQKLTETGFALGTCHYMSPEQCTGAQIDGRSDLYSAGCILYQCLTGKIPFDGEESIQVMYKHLNEFPEPLEAVLGKSDQSAALQRFIDNCMAKAPEDRYSSADEALKDLRAIARGAYGSVRALSDPKAQRRSMYAARKPSAPSPLVVSMSALLLGGALTAFCLWLSSSSNNAADSSRPLKHVISDLKLTGSATPEEFVKVGPAVGRIEAALKTHAGVNREPEYHELCAIMSDYYLYDRHDVAKSEVYARMGDTPGFHAIDPYELKCHERLMDLWAQQSRLDEIDSLAWDKLVTNSAVRRDEYLQVLVSDYWRRGLEVRLEQFLERYLKYPRISEYDKGLIRYVSGNLRLIKGNLVGARRWYEKCVHERSNASMRKRAAARLCLMDGKYADVMGGLSYYNESLLPALDITAAANLHDSKGISAAIANLLAHRNTIPELPPGMDEFDANMAADALEKNGYKSDATRLRSWLKESGL